MALGYSVHVDIDLLYNPENVLLILEKGKSLSMKYHFLNDQYEFSKDEITTHQALEILLEKDFFKIRWIPVIYLDTSFFLHILTEDKKIIVMLSSLSHRWSKEFLNNIEDLDMDRYSRLMLDLVGDHKIESFKIVKD